MVDFIFKSDSSSLDFADTYLGSQLLKNGLTEDFLKHIKEFPIVYIDRNSKKELVNIIDESTNKSIEESIELIKSIVK